MTTGARTRTSPAPGTPVATHEVAGGGGLRLDVREWGDPDGAPVILIHGWSQSHLCWSRQLAGGLGRGLRLVAFDLRGHGMSERPTDVGHYADPRLWADDLAAIIDGLALRRPVLVAWSYGGFVATDYVRAYGDRAIGGVNLVGGAVVLAPPGFEHIGPGFLGNAPDACRPELATSIAAVRRFMRACTARPLHEDDRETALCWTMVVPPEVRGALIARSIDATDVLAGLSVPLLVSHGRRDAIVLPSMAELVLDVCPTAEPSWYEDAGHMPFVEDTARFDGELARFVARAGT